MWEEDEKSEKRTACSKMKATGPQRLSQASRGAVLGKAGRWCGQGGQCAPPEKVVFESEVVAGWAGARTSWSRGRCAWGVWPSEEAGRKGGVREEVECVGCEDQLNRAQQDCAVHSVRGPCRNQPSPRVSHAHPRPSECPVLDFLASRIGDWANLIPL